MRSFSSHTEMLEALHSGAHAAFDEVYTSYFKPLCYFAEKITGDAVVAQDMVSETFFKLLQKQPSFETVESLKSFLYISTRNSCLDHLRMKKRHDASHADIRYFSEGMENETEGRIVMAEVLHAVYAAIEELPEKYVRVLKLALVAGMSNEEIMAETGMAYQTVRNHKSEGIKLLKLALFRNEALSQSLLIYCMLHIMLHS